MKRIECLIRPFKLEEVKAGLATIGTGEMTITEVKGCDHRIDHTQLYRGQEYNVDTLRKLKVEIICSDEKTDAVIQSIISNATTGKQGDGKIFVSPVDTEIEIEI